MDSGGWGNQIFPYVKSLQIFKCPSASKFSDAYNNADYGTYNSTYAMNAMIGMGPSGSTGPGQYRYNPFAFGQYAPVAFNESNVAAPAVTIALCEEAVPTVDPASNYKAANGQVWLGVWENMMNVGGGTGTGFVYSSYSLPAVYFSQIHLAGENLAFCDGHVKWFSQSKLAWLGSGSIPLSGYKNGTWGPYQNNGIADFQPLTSTTAGP
jgi:hypothetical protein